MTYPPYPLSPLFISKQWSRKEILFLDMLGGWESVTSWSPSIPELQSEMDLIIDPGPGRGEAGRMCVGVESGDNNYH